MDDCHSSEDVSFKMRGCEVERSRLGAVKLFHVAELNQTVDVKLRTSLKGFNAVCLTIEHMKKVRHKKFMRGK